MHKNNRRNELPRSNSTYFSILQRSLFFAFIVITTLAIFVPLNPGMPHSGLDPSWVFSMNEAVAQHLTLGKEVIFTFGPYASIYTTSYHPQTDHLMIFGSLFLGLCYAASLIYLVKDKEPYLLFVLLLFLAAFMYSRDPLLFSYPLILAASVSKYIAADDMHKHADPTPWEVLVSALVFAPIGLLPLVKGSLSLICGATTIVIFAFLLYHRYRKLALIVLVSPMATAPIFWMISGQSLISFPGYVLGMSQIISGYTEAMAVQSDNTGEIFGYLLAAIAIIWTLVKTDRATVPTKVFLIICFGLFLFIAFKGGFTRHDGHAIVAGTSLAIAALLVGLISAERRTMFVVFLSIAVWAYIDKSYINTSTRQVFENIGRTYADIYEGLGSRIGAGNVLKERFDHSLDEIRKEYAVPTLQGTTDIYSYDQAYLFASNNEWNPRPIIQSYSVYTPRLAQINEQHLRGNNAPDNILFRVQPIDGRLPSLEDGLSWPALFDNYTVTKLDNHLAFLRRKQTIQSGSAFDTVYEGTRKIGEDVMLPRTVAPIYAEIDLKPTFLGKLLGIVFKPPQLKLAVRLGNGQGKDYRVMSNMMQSGFFISPLVENTKDFIFLATGNHEYLRNSMVKSIAITASYGRSIFWSDTYTLKLKAYRGEAATALPGDFFDGVINSIPEGYARSKSADCDGMVDEINGVSPFTQETKASGTLAIEGWLAVSGKDGVGPDDIFVTLRNPSGAIKYLKTRRTPRNDVKVHFKQLTMPDVGFTASVDANALAGEYVLGLARGYQGKLQHCNQFNIPVRLGQVN